jgi:Domain of unknown function (DUF4365)
MQRPPSAQTERLGVAETQVAVLRLGWVFREQPIEDTGIDAHVEVVDHGQATGKLLVLQIKGGQSWFREPGPGGWWFRPDDNHVRYWTDHSLPVAVVLWHPETSRCHWQLVNEQTLVPTSTGGRKLLVPEEQVLDETAIGPLRAAEGDPYVLRIRELQLARPWMQLVADGNRLIIDIEELINKPSGRGSIALGLCHDLYSRPTRLAEWTVLLGSASYAEVIPRLFAWANVDVHEETYEDADEDEYEADCVRIDSEGDRIRRPGLLGVGGGARRSAAAAIPERAGRGRLLAPRADPQRVGQGVPAGRQVRGRKHEQLTA